MIGKLQSPKKFVRSDHAADLGGTVCACHPTVRITGMRAAVGGATSCGCLWKLRKSIIGMALWRWPIWTVGCVWWLTVLMDGGRSPTARTVDVKDYGITVFEIVAQFDICLIGCYVWSWSAGDPA
jgi:hypothetical protein